MKKPDEFVRLFLFQIEIILPAFPYNPKMILIFVTKSF